MRKIYQVEKEQLSLHERLQHELSCYPRKTIQADGFCYRRVCTKLLFFG